MNKIKITAIILSLILLAFTGCSTVQDVIGESTTVQAAETTTTISNTDDISTSVISSSVNSILDTSGMFTSRDLEQSADLAESVSIGLENNTDVNITEEGVYVISGDTQNTTIIIDADDEAKVQLVLDGVNITNEDSPAIYIKSSDKVFITTTDSNNNMEVTGNFEADGETNLDSVIFSKSDLVLNGTGTLTITSEKGNGISSKDDLKITGGVYEINASADGIEANDSIRIYDGDITIVSDKDAIHCENEDDTTLGYIYILNGTMNISAADDAIRGNSIIQIDGGAINIEKCAEGIEATYIQINGGDINIYATDDGINATEKSDYDIVIEVNGGTITVSVATGDTDAFDSNGVIYINGGIIDITAVSSFDANVLAELNGGVVTVNGQIITEITQMQTGGKKH